MIGVRAWVRGFAILVGGVYAAGAAQTADGAVQDQHVHARARARTGVEDRAARVAAIRRDAAAAHPPSPSQLSDRLTKIGVELLEAGETDEAVELLAEAVGRDPDNGAALSALILGYLTREELSFADFYLEQAVESESRRDSSPAAYLRIGNRYAADHHLAEAITAWDYARRLGSTDPGMLAALERTRKELAIARPQRLAQSEHFSLYTDDAIPEDVAARVEAHLEEEQARFEKFFGLPPDQASRVVILYSGREYFSLVSVPTWVSGIFDGKIRVSLEAPARWSPELAAILTHELSHAFLRDASHGNAPAWLHEGLAQWLEGKRVAPSELHQALAGRRLASISELAASLPDGDREAIRRRYLEMLALVQHLVAQHGIGSIACIVRDMASGKSTNEAFHDELSLSASQVMTQLSSWLDR